MSTRSFIIAHDPETGRYGGIYCHFDGYLEGVGDTLKEHYSDPAKVKALIALGDLSALYPALEPAPGEKHSFGNAAKGVTIAYMRDRGETGCEAVWKDCWTDILEIADNSNAEYVYVWKDGMWHVVDPAIEGKSGMAVLTPFADALAAEQAQEAG